MRPVLSLLLAAAVSAADPGVQPAGGIDVIDAARQAAQATGLTAGAKPWSEALAGLTDPDPGRGTRSIGELIRFGAPVLPDLAQLAKDRNPDVRGRVVRVCGGIGGSEAAPLALELSRDQQRTVRELAALALGACSGPGVFERLAELARDRDGDLRAAAGEALGSLGDLRALPILAGHAGDGDTLARRAKQKALVRVARRVEAVPELVRLLEAKPPLEDARRQALVEAAAEVGDPRLGPPLAALLGSADAYLGYLAAKALALVGDSRCVEPLTRAAAGDGPIELRTAAAETLRTLTGYAAGPGQVWSIWWRDHAAEIAALAERDALIARLHDPAAPIRRQDLAAFAPGVLMGLVDSTFPRTASDARAPWWPRRAWDVLRADDPSRWTAPLVERIDRTPDTYTRTLLIVVLDQLGGPASAEALRGLRARLDDRAKREAESYAASKLAPPDLGAERAALDEAIDRRR